MYVTDAYVGVIKYDDFYLVAVYPAAEAWENWKVSIIVLILIDAIVFALLFFLIRRLMKRQVLDGIEDINDSLTRITGGDLNEKVNFRDSIEFEGLSDGINYTVDRLKGLIKEAEERIDAELALAAKIQTSFLPHKFPAFPDRKEFELYAAMVPAKEVGGDFYDYFFTDEDHLALVIADVSGKGIPAAMFMAVSMDKIRHSVMKYGTDVSGAMTEVNLELLKENDAGLFVTVWLGVINVSTGHVDYVDAGHEYPAICRAGGEFTADEDVHSGPVAALKRTKFEAGSFELKAGDILYLYTDGLTEANNPEGEMFRINRVLDALNINKDSEIPLSELDENVRTRIAEFAKDEPQFDDMTTLLYRHRSS
jgi:serine phosphatase RsbU (regulator of sigma subunit)